MVNMDKNDIKQRMDKLDENVGWSSLLGKTRPNNINHERERVFHDSSYNPHFEYDELPFSPKEVYEEIRILENTIGSQQDSLPKDIYLGQLHQYISNTKYLEARDSKELQNASEAIFSRPEDDEKAVAWVDFKIELPMEDKPFFPQLVKKYMHIYNRRLPLIGKTYSIFINSDVTGITPIEEKSKVDIPERNVSSLKMVGDLVHEFGTHIVQYEVGCLQDNNLSIPAFRTGFPARSFISEGLARYNEDQVAPNYALNKKVRAGHIVAMDVAEDNSFSDVYNMLKKAGFESKQAFHSAMMVKRGFRDTSVPWVNFNRNLYSKGHKMVKEYLEKGGEEWVLYTGRISLDYVDRIKNLEGLKRVPDDFPQRMRNLARELVFK
jgi:hypothetical protein